MKTVIYQSVYNNKIVKLIRDNNQFSMYYGGELLFEDTNIQSIEKKFEIYLLKNIDKSNMHVINL